jgi:rod shape-determining protein MreD
VTGPNLVRLAVLTFLVLVIQSTVGLDIRVGGAHPDLMLLLPIAAGLVGGPNAGAWVGFGAGLVADLFVPAPFGLTALTYTLVGFGVGAVLALAARSLAGVDGNSWWLAGLVALAASVIAVMLYAVLGALIGQEQMLKLDLGVIAAVVAVPNALLAVPAVRAMNWALGVGPRGAEHRVTGSRS